MAPKGVQMGVGVKECQQEMKRKKSTIRIKKETTKIQSMFHSENDYFRRVL